MAMYETIFILDSLLPQEDIDKIIERVTGIIEENKGKVTRVDRWGKRRLAYEIQKKQYGYYVAVEFESDGAIPQLLESDYNYNDKVLRYLTYLYDKKKMKSIEKAKAEALKEENPEPEPKKAEPAAKVIETAEPEATEETREAGDE